MTIHPSPSSSSSQSPTTTSTRTSLTTELQSTWTTLYKQNLPALARARSPAQPHWPVHLDHCFARIILDAVIGGSGNNSSPTSPPFCADNSSSSAKSVATGVPWTARLSSPAVKHMTAAQLEGCITLGRDIAAGRADLVALDERSLAVRGKVKGGKRKRMMAGEDTKTKQVPSSKRSRTINTQKSQPSILTMMAKSTNGTIISTTRTNLSSPSSTHRQPQPRPHPTSQQKEDTPPSPISPDLHALITNPDPKSTSIPTLSPFRQRVLLSLCQIPPGRVSTYAALARHLASAPRAVGSALRRNPFAPRVPCHRIVAADGGIGGFNGEWGDEGKFCGDKVGLLRGEGVVVREKKGRLYVQGRVWEGFVSVSLSV